MQASNADRSDVVATAELYRYFRGVFRGGPM